MPIILIFIAAVAVVGFFAFTFNTFPELGDVGAQPVFSAGDRVRVKATCTVHTPNEIIAAGTVGTIDLVFPYNGLTLYSFSGTNSAGALVNTAFVHDWNCLELA